MIGGADAALSHFGFGARSWREGQHTAPGSISSPAWRWFLRLAWVECKQPAIAYATGGSLRRVYESDAGREVFRNHQA